MQPPGIPYVIEVNPKLPSRLARLEDLANNLWYSWDRATRELFQRLDPALWNAVGQSPKAFLKRLDEHRLVGWRLIALTVAARVVRHAFDTRFTSSVRSRQFRRPRGRADHTFWVWASQESGAAR